MCHYQEAQSDMTDYRPVFLQEATTRCRSMTGSNRIETAPSNRASVILVVLVLPPIAPMIVIPWWCRWPHCPFQQLYFIYQKTLKGAYLNRSRVAPFQCIPYCWLLYTTAFQYDSTEPSCSHLPLQCAIGKQAAPRIRARWSLKLQLLLLISRCSHP